VELGALPSDPRTQGIAIASLECPSCHNTTKAIFQCNDCHRMYCTVCCNFISTMMGVFTLGAFGEIPMCGECVGIGCGQGRIVSIDDDGSEGSAEDTSSEPLYSSSDDDSSSYSGGGSTSYDTPSRSGTSTAMATSTPGTLVIDSGF